MKYLILVFFFLLSCCVSNEHQSSPKALTVMTFNVENLFDTLDDPGKNDETYLPIEQKRSARHRAKCQNAKKKWWIKQCMELDWSETKVRRKLVRIADTILQIKDGKGPDILILQEVENLNIVERLRLNHLQTAGYKPAILIEGPDKRGIDVAMLSRLPLAKKPKLHEVDLVDINRHSPHVVKNIKVRPTRGILEAQFGLPGGKTLTAFGVHFPSQGSPTPARRKAIKKLNSLIENLPKDQLAIAAGDFNITAEEDAEKRLFSKDLAQNWIISHQIGCDDCYGTHNYRGKWSFLDAILFSKNFEFGDWKVDAKSIRVANGLASQTNHFGSPARFDGGISQKGVSDHYPLAADIVPKGVKK